MSFLRKRNQDNTGGNTGETKGQGICEGEEGIRINRTKKEKENIRRVKATRWSRVYREQV